MISELTFLDATSSVSSFNSIPGKERLERILSWQLPTKLNNNDPNTLSYAIMWCKNDLNCASETLKNKFSYMLTSLVPSTNYTVSVTVVNELGQNSSAVSIIFSTLGCTADEFQCKTERTCISINMVCDGAVDCVDYSDENHISGCGK